MRNRYGHLDEVYECEILSNVGSKHAKRVLNIYSQVNLDYIIYHL
jgi:hypothetical protein